MTTGTKRSRTKIADMFNRDSAARNSKPKRRHFNPFSKPPRDRVNPNPDEESGWIGGLTDVNVKHPGIYVSVAVIVLALVLYELNPMMMSWLLWLPTAFLAWKWVQRFIGHQNKVYAVTGFIAYWFFISILFIMFLESAQIYSGIFTDMAINQPPINFHNMGADFFRPLPFGVGWLIARLLTIIGDTLTRLQITMFGLLGILCFAVIQFLEVLPMVIHNSPNTLKAFYNAIGRFQVMVAGTNETKLQQQLRKRHNNYFTRFFRALRIAQIGAFTVDVIVCILYAPIFNLGLTGVGFDPRNAWRVAITVFLFYIVVYLMIEVRKAIDVLIGGKQRRKAAA